MPHSSKPETIEVQTAQAVDPAAICSAWVKLRDSRPPEGALVAVRQPAPFYQRPLLWLCGEVAKKGRYHYIIGATTGNPIMMTESAIWLQIAKPNDQLCRTNGGLDTTTDKTPPP